MSEPSIRPEPRLAAPDNVYEALLSLADGLDEAAAHTALAAFALLLANHIGDDAVVLQAVAAVKRAFAQYPQAMTVGARHPDGQSYHVGGALAALRKVIELKPAPSVPGALTS